MITAQELLRGPKLKRGYRISAFQPKGKKKVIADYLDDLPRGVWFSGNSLRLMFKCAPALVREVLDARCDLGREWNSRTRAYGWVKV